MPGFPFPGRPGGEHDEPLLDMIIARRDLPPDAPQAMHDLAHMLAVLAGPAEPGELAGEAAVRAAFDRATSPVGVSSTARRPVRHRRSRRSRGRSRSRARLATVMVVAVAGLGSVLAAYIDVLPSPIQQLAHVVAAAPAPPGSGANSLAASGTRRAPPKTPVTSQPAAGPHHSAGAAPSPGPGNTATPSNRPLHSPSPGHGRPTPSCLPSLWRPPGPSATGSARSSPSPSRSQSEHCSTSSTSPTEKPTLNPYVP
jgi:hypothetical protein